MAPDVFPAGDNTLFCSTCETVLNWDLESFSHPSKTLSSPQSHQGSLNLKWPSSVHYEEKCILTDEGEDITPTLVETLGRQRSSLSNDSGYVSQQSDPHVMEGFVPLKKGDNIRLLKLKPGAWDDPLQGDLDIVSLDTQPFYETISYTWADEHGDSTRCRPLYITRSWHVLPITRNCESALRRLRLLDYNRVLWVDSVCINQQSTNERSHQVAMMCRIYSNATRCLVYLGEEADNSDLAVEFLQFHNVASPDTTKKYAGPVSRLFQRPYFRRLWVLQELVLSRDILVHCGESTTHWANISRKVWKGFPTFNVPQWIKGFDLFRYNRVIDFPRFLHESSELQASDDRDKIFGLLGMIQELDQAGFVADYSLSVPQLYTGVAAYIISNHNLTYIITLTRSSEPGMPSWVPDWRSVQPGQWASHQTDKYGLSQRYAELLVQLEPKMKESYKHRESRRETLVWSKQGSSWICSFIPPPPGGNIGSGEHVLQVHGPTGALIIEVRRLVRLHGFKPTPRRQGSSMYCKVYRAAFRTSFHWSIISTSPDIEDDDCCALIQDSDVLLHLRKTTNIDAYRIVGYCAFGAVLSQDNVDIIWNELPPLASSEIFKLMKAATDNVFALEEEIAPYTSPHDPDVSFSLDTIQAARDTIALWGRARWADKLWNAFILPKTRRLLQPTDVSSLDEHMFCSLGEAINAYYSEFIWQRNVQSRPRTMELASLLFQAVQFWANPLVWDVSRPGDDPSSDVNQELPRALISNFDPFGVGLDSPYPGLQYSEVSIWAGLILGPTPWKMCYTLQKVDDLNKYKGKQIDFSDDGNVDQRNEVLLITNFIGRFVASCEGDLRGVQVTRKGEHLVQALYSELEGIEDILESIRHWGDAANGKKYATNTVIFNDTIFLNLSERLNRLSRELDQIDRVLYEEQKNVSQEKMRLDDGEDNSKGLTIEEDLILKRHLMVEHLRSGTGGACIRTYCWLTEILKEIPVAEKVDHKIVIL